ncbi:MAG: DNA internalization-related competence protein ComEC/Rec2 [Sporolactobacillus sp.]
MNAAQLSGRFHLLTFSACLSAWAASATGSVRGLLIGVLVVYLLWLSVKRCFLFLILLTTVAALIFTDYCFFQESGTHLNRTMTQLSGKVDDIPDVDGNRLTFTLKTQQGEHVKVSFKLRTFTEKKTAERTMSPGAVITVSGEMNKPPLPKNFYRFDYRRYLADHHVYWIMQASALPHVVALDRSPLERLKRFRQTEVAAIHRLFSAQTAAVAASLIYGDDREMDEELAEAYQYLGLVHLLVVSGSHIAVVFGVLSYLLKRAGCTRENVSLICMVLIPLYVLLTGAEPSIVRAGLTACLFFFARLVSGKPPPASDLLSISCLLMLFADPKVIFDLGFQLSFAVTFALILTGPNVIAKYHSVLMRLFAVALISELAAFPILIGHFYRFTPISFFLSVAYVPYLSFVILPAACVVYLFARLIPGAASVTGLFDELLGWPHELLRFIYEHPLFDLNYGALDAPLLLFAFCLIAATVAFWEKVGGRRSLLLLFVPFLILYAAVEIIEHADATGTVTFLNVGQGDSILIKLSHSGGNVLIDTGGSLPVHQPSWARQSHPYDVGSDTLLPELRALRVNQIDVVVLTHGDADHINGFKALIGQLSVKRVLISPYFDPNAGEQRMLRQAAAAGAQLTVIRKDDQFRVGTATFHVLSPDRRAADGNDNSLVITARLGGLQFLFTGDLSVKGEQLIMAAGSKIRADVLKLGHHGSRSATSAAWLARVNPALAIVSCGENNRYGHPHPEVIARLRQRHIQVLRTDQDGDIRLSFHDRSITAIETSKK